MAILREEIFKLTEDVLSLILEHLGERLTVIGDKEICEAAGMGYPLDPYDWDLCGSEGIRAIPEAQLQHTFSQIKKLLGNR